MHCPSASSFLNVLSLYLIYVFTVCYLFVCVRACVYGQLQVLDSAFLFLLVL